MTTSKKKEFAVVAPNYFEPYNMLATWFGLGNANAAQGTLGSLMAIAVWLLFNNSLLLLKVPIIFGYFFWMLLLTLLFFAGADAAQIYCKKTKSNDASSIIIDEVVGQLVTLLLSFNFVAKYIIDDNNMINSTALAYHLLLSFILFRVFDITKPSIIGMVDKKIKSGYGVMLDDLFAGVISAAIICLTITIIKQF